RSLIYTARLRERFNIVACPSLTLRMTLLWRESAGKGEHTGGDAQDGATNPSSTIKSILSREGLPARSFGLTSAKPKNPPLGASERSDADATPAAWGSYSGPNRAVWCSWRWESSGVASLRDGDCFLGAG